MRLLGASALAAAALVAFSAAQASGRAASCFPASAHAKLLRFPNSEGTKLVGYELGSGPRGIVLAHMYAGDACQWAGYAPELARRGFHVLAFDFHGFGRSPAGPGEDDIDVVAAAAELRALGARRIVLIGASMGGTASLVAAAELKPPPVAVVSLSGPGNFDLMSAYDAVPKLGAGLPKLFVVGSGDVEFAGPSRELYRRAHGLRERVVLQTADHGVALLDDAPATRAIDAVLKRAFP